MKEKTSGGVEEIFLKFSGKTRLMKKVTKKQSFTLFLENKSFWKNHRGEGQI